MSNKVLTITGIEINHPEGLRRYDKDNNERAYRKMLNEILTFYMCQVDSVFKIEKTPYRGWYVIVDTDEDKVIAILAPDAISFLIGDYLNMNMLSFYDILENHGFQSMEYMISDTFGLNDDILRPHH